MKAKKVLAGLLSTVVATAPAVLNAQDANDDLDFLLAAEPGPTADSAPAPTEPVEAEPEIEPAADAGTPVEPADLSGAEREAGAAAPATVEPYAETISVAQDAEPLTSVAEPPPRRRIEEIVVTAQKREESLQDVPIAIQAFSGDVLIDKGITDTQSLAQVTPGLVYASNAGYAQAYIRGIGSDATLPTADPSVATYVDGIYYPMIQSTIQSFANIERIEILKGPQGTLFGRNTTGGAINVVTKDPGQEREYSVLLEGAEHGHYRASLYGSVPLGDSLAVSLSGFYDRTDAWYEQTNPAGPEILDTQNWGLRMKLAFNPGGLGIAEDFTAVLSGYILDHEGADTNIVNQFKPSALATLLGASATPEPFRAGTDLPDTNITRIEGVNLKATLNFDAIDLVSISGYQNVENYGTVDYDATPAAAAGFGAHPGLSESFSQELQLLSAGWDRVDWVVGGYYFTGSGGFVPLNFGLTGVLPAALLDPLSPIVENLLPILLNPLPPVPVPPITIPNTPEVVSDLLGLLGNALPIEELIAVLGNSGLLDLPGNAAYISVPLVSVVDTEAYAAFTQVTWRAADWLNLTAGLRYSDETRELTRNEIYAPRIFTDPTTFDQTRGLVGSPLVSRAPRSESWDDLSTKFVIEFPFENLGFIDSGMIYAGRTEGFKSGTWNVVALTDEPAPVEPEEVVSWEGGFKTDLFNGNARFNASVFSYDYKNLQLQTIALTSGGAVRLENAADAELQGVDAELMIAPLDGLMLTLAGSWLETEFLECNCSGFEENTGVGFRGDFAGNELVNAPKYTTTVDLSYTFGFWGGPLELAGTWYHNDGHWFDAQNSFRQEAYDVLSARINYTHERSNLRFTVFGQNLNDELYLLNGNVNDFGRFGTYAPPRLIGLRVQWPAV